MAYNVVELTPHAAVKLTPSVTIHCGSVRLGGKGNLSVVRPDAPPEEFGFFVPDAVPLAYGEAEPQAIAEAYLMAVTAISLSSRNLQGLDRVIATYAPDPRASGAKWLRVTGLAYAPAPIRLGYRVTICRAA